jgi:hypothetical protein
MTYWRCLRERPEKWVRDSMSQARTPVHAAEVPADMVSTSGRPSATVKADHNPTPPPPNASSRNPLSYASWQPLNPHEQVLVTAATDASSAQLVRTGEVNRGTRVFCGRVQPSLASAI